MISLISSVLDAADAHDWPTLLNLAKELDCPSRTNPAPPGRDVYLVTGGAGFIGSHLSRRLLQDGRHVIVFDDFNNYYDPLLKHENVDDLFAFESFELHEIDIRDLEQMRACLAGRRIDVIVHLAARAGVRPSVADPQLYVTTNVLGTQNMLDIAREHEVASFVYASSSSVYGESDELPLCETQRIDNPISPYAATKRANEGQAACYSHLYGLPVVGLRFFSVYGPSGRPDMAIRQFIEKLDRAEAVTIYGDGSFERDFTYIDDIIEGVLSSIRISRGRRGFRAVFNLGESDTTSVRELLLLIASELRLIDLPRDAKSLTDDEAETRVRQLIDRGLVRRMAEQPGDVHRTFADIVRSRRELGYSPRVPITDGIRRTISWHKQRLGRVSDARREALDAATRLLSDLRLRSALDRFGRQRRAEYSLDDVNTAALALRRIMPDGADGQLSPRPRRLAFGLTRLLGEIAARIQRDESKAIGRP